MAALLALLIALAGLASPSEITGGGPPGAPASAGFNGGGPPGAPVSNDTSGGTPTRGGGTADDGNGGGPPG